MARKPTLYLETTVVSYYTAKPSRDVVALAHQEITRRFWERSLPRFAVYISEIVLEEARRGDRDASRARLEALAGFPLLQVTEDTERLAEEYLRRRVVPRGKPRDALHIALATLYRMDFLATWNCGHIASGDTRRRLRDIHSRQGLPLPIICTPEELLE